MKLDPPTGTARLQFAWIVIAAGLFASLALDNLAELMQIGDQTRQTTQRAQQHSIAALAEARCGLPAAADTPSAPAAPLPTPPAPAGVPPIPSDPAAEPCP